MSSTPPPDDSPKSADADDIRDERKRMEQHPIIQAITRGFVREAKKLAPKGRKKSGE
jgi:hypothetical protein